MWKSPADLMDDYDLLHAVVRRLLTFHVIKVGVFILLWNFRKNEHLIWDVPVVESGENVKKDT